MDFKARNEARKKQLRQKTLKQSQLAKKLRFDEENIKKQESELQKSRLLQRQQQDDEEDNEILSKLDINNIDRGLIDGIHNNKTRSNLQHLSNLQKTKYEDFVKEVNKERDDDIFYKTASIGTEVVKSVINNKVPIAPDVGTVTNPNDTFRQKVNNDYQGIIDKLEGGSFYCHACNTTFKSKASHVKSKKHIQGAGLFDFFIKNGYSSSAAKMIKEYGGWRIVKLNIYRKPIKSGLDKVLNLISLGGFQKGKQASQYDTMFHLGLFCIITNNSGTFANMLVEKNATIEISRTSFDVSNYGEIMPVPILKSISFGELLKNGEDKLKENYFLYDPFNGDTGKKGTNCQGFVRGLLEGSGLYTEQINRFVFQPLDILLKNVAGYVPEVSRVVTDIGAMASNIADKFFGGKLTLHAIKIKKGSMKNEEMIKHAESIAGRKKMLQKEYKNYIGFRVIPKQRFKSKTYRSKKVNENIMLVFGELK